MDLENSNTISSDLIRGHINTIILNILYENDRYGYEIGSKLEVQIVAINKDALHSYIYDLLPSNGIHTVKLAGLPFAEPSEDDSPGSVRIFAYQHWTLPDRMEKLTPDNLDKYHIIEYTLKNGGQLQP